jgi:hypothetical protein
MAETDDNDNARRFLSLPDTLAFLEQHTGSSAYAELLLREGAASGLIRCRERETEVHFPDRGNLRVLGRVYVPHPPLQGAEFWRVSPLDNSAQLKFDRRRAEITRIDHAAQTLDGTWCEHRIVRKRGVRFSEDDLRAMLQLEGLLLPGDAPPPLPPALATLAATEAGDTGAINGAVTAAASAPMPTTEPANEPIDVPSVRPPSRRRQRIVAVLLCAYSQKIPSKGEAIKGDLVRAVENNWNSPAVPNPEKLPLPSRDTIERVIDDLWMTS